MKRVIFGLSLFIVCMFLMASGNSEGMMEKEIIPSSLRIIEQGVIPSHHGHSHGIIYDYVEIKGANYLIVSACNSGGVSVLKVEP